MSLGPPRRTNRRIASGNLLTLKNGGGETRSKFVWEAGNRTPITCSRGSRPTVGRPPSTGRGAPKETELSIIAARKRTQQARRPAWVVAPPSANVFGTEHLFAVAGIRAAALLFLLPAMA